MPVYTLNFYKDIEMKLDLKLKKKKLVNLSLDEKKLSVNVTPDIGGASPGVSLQACSYACISKHDFLCDVGKPGQP